MYLLDLLGKSPHTINKSRDWTYMAGFGYKICTDPVIYFKIKIQAYSNYNHRQVARLIIICYTSTGQIEKFVYDGRSKTKKEFQDECESQNLTYELIENTY